MRWHGLFVARATGSWQRHLKRHSGEKSNKRLLFKRKKETRKQGRAKGSWQRPQKRQRPAKRGEYWIPTCQPTLLLNTENILGTWKSAVNGRVFPSACRARIRLSSLLTQTSVCTHGHISFIFRYLVSVSEYLFWSRCLRLWLIFYFFWPASK